MKNSIAAAERAQLQPAVPDLTHSASDEARIEQRLADAIYEHRIPPGTKLGEVELCRIFGVTRGVIRKALAQLASEELVDLIPNRGAFVARPSVDETRDVYELRRILETGVIRRLATIAGNGWIEDVRSQIAAEREAKRSGDTPKYIRLSGKFHLDLAAATRNAALERHLQRVVAQTSLMMALYDVPGTNICSFHEHLEILETIESGDFAKAEQLMDDHLRGCERQLRLDGDVRRVDLADALGGTPPEQRPHPTVAARLKRRARGKPATTLHSKPGGKAR